MGKNVKKRTKTKGLKSSKEQHSIYKDKQIISLNIDVGHMVIQLVAFTDVNALLKTKNKWIELLKPRTILNDIQPDNTYKVSLQNFMIHSKADVQYINVKTIVSVTEPSDTIVNMYMDYFGVKYVTT